MGRSPTVARINANSSPSSSSSFSSSSAESSFRELDDVFLQTQTRIWLGEVLQTRLDDQLPVSDLLADGELLFEVSKSVWTMLLAKCKELRHVKGPKYKPVGSRKSSGRYRPYSNVDSFLKICKILGLNGIDLFSPSDVVEKRDTRKVCICIRSLSKRARSKQLNVPDFDIVTYAVAMPTNLVGCLRRSLELSQGSFTSSANDNPHKDSASKFGQKNQVAALRNYDSYSEASDDSESNYIGMQSYCLSTNYSHDTALLSYSDVENSPGASSVVKKYTSAHGVSQEDIQGQEKEEYEQGRHSSACLAERVLCSQYVKSDHACDNSQKILNVHEMAAPDLIDVESGIGNDASIVRDSLGDICNQFPFPDLNVFGTENEYPFLFDGEDSMFNLLMGTDSHGSNSTGRTSQNGSGRRLSDNFEDVEVSSLNSFSSVLDRALNLDFDDQSNADDLSTAKINLTDLQNYEADSLDSSPTRGFEFGSEQFHRQSHTEDSVLKNQDITNRDINSQGPHTLYAVAVENPAVNYSFVVPAKQCQPSAEKHPCSTMCSSANVGEKSHQPCMGCNEDLDCAEYSNKDESRHENVDNLAELSGGRKHKSARLPHGKPHRKPLLRTVVEGTTLFGILCLLLHLRSKSGREKTGEVRKRSSHVQKANGMEFTSRKERNGGRVNGVYPAEKLNLF